MYNTAISIDDCFWNSPTISFEKPDMEMRASGSPTNVEAFLDTQANRKTKTNAPHLPQNFARRDLARLMNTMVKIDYESNVFSAYLVQVVVVTSEKVQTVPQFHGLLTIFEGKLVAVSDKQNIVIERPGNRVSF